MKIHIFGASGSGTTTLANELADKLNYVHLDADEYYWRKTNPPFQEKIPLSERSNTLQLDFQKNVNVIVSGSLVTWGDYWVSAFDLAIFLLIPSEVRMRRLSKREQERYGDQLINDHTIADNSQAFLEWARKYDDPSFDGRSIKQHQDWIKKLTCKTLKITGDTSIEKRIQLVRESIKKG
ncbi:AAA family ATPase [Ekhidna sp.]